MIQLTITIREGKDKVGVCMEIKKSPGYSEKELEEFEAVYDLIMQRPESLAQTETDGFIHMSGRGKTATKMLKTRINNL